MFIGRGGVRVPIVLNFNLLKFEFSVLSILYFLSEIPSVTFHFLGFWVGALSLHSHLDLLICRCSLVLDLDLVGQ